MITGRHVSTGLAAGEIITYPRHQLRVTTTDFARQDGFQHAVAQVAIEQARSAHEIGSHIETPFGLVQVIADDRGFVELEAEDEDY